MKFYSIAVAAVLAGGTTYAFSPNHHIRTFGAPSAQRICPLSMSLAEKTQADPSTGSRGARTKNEIMDELTLGKKMEGGHVVDFASVKGSSKAERALAKARESLPQRDLNDVSVNEMMGINREVIAEVGHELGTFVADATEVQKCASYLRSTAPPGYFAQAEQRPRVTSVENFSDKEIKGFKDILAKAYVESGEVTGAFAKTFYMGTLLMPEEARKAIWAVYVWCRRTDEIVDAPRDNDEEMLTDLSSWEVRLENLWKYGEVEDVLDLPLLDIRIKYPALSIEPFVDMIRGMLMDVPDLGQDRYETFDELHLYCYRVAGTVGLMSMPVFGCAPGFTEEIAKEPALSLGVAFQITNILRDVGEDAVKRGRIYLPRQDMEKFGVTEEQIFSRRVDENYIALMKYEIARARMYYDRALRGVPMLSEESRLPVQASLDCYGAILDKIEENGYDSLNKRAYVDKWEKLFTIPFSWYRTLDIAKTFPLPGDRSLIEVA